MLVSNYQNQEIMKKINSYVQVALLVLLIGTITSSCEDFLEEENRTNLTDENAFDEPGAFAQLVANTYNKMRAATIRFSLDNTGTDIITRKAIIAGANELNDYVNIDPANGTISDYWNDHYDVVTAANLTISRVNEIPGLSDEEIDLGLGEVRFFRAFAYFKLVEQFGDVPLILEEITTARTDFTRAPQNEVYEQILSDLDDAIANVEANPEQYGRVSKDAARHLKAKVLLTRGYKSFANSSDFADAAALAETVIASHPLVSDFASLTSIENQRNSEVILAMLYGTEQLAVGRGNNRHKLFKFTYDLYPGMERTQEFNNGTDDAPTPFYYTLFEDEDEREEATLRRVIFAIRDSDDGSILIGDTAIFFPEVPWTDEQKAGVNYQVVNEGDYFRPNGFSTVHFPMFRRYDDPVAPLTTTDGNPLGQRDAAIIRSGETILLAAEAQLNAGNAEAAANHLNTLRARAGITTILSAADVDLDFILDERARELAGEVSRWLDLKRTGKLIERVLAHNPHAALNNAIEPRHLVRPIPQAEVDLSNGSIRQNDDY